jgi:sigma-B regulation protein RsbU (phosphoserine phosphatase)
LPGGDYFDVLPLPGGRLAVLIADASGHGGPAAVLVAQLRTLLHSCPLCSGRDRELFCLVSARRPPEVLMAYLNQVVGENSLDDSFLTTFVGHLDPQTGQLCYANAGHPPPRWFRAAAGVVEAVPDVAGPPLGVVPGVAYRAGTSPWAPATSCCCTPTA